RGGGNFTLLPILIVQDRVIGGCQQNGIPSFCRESRKLDIQRLGIFAFSPHKTTLSVNLDVFPVFSGVDQDYFCGL
ncbi:hypothetical protein, partial [Yersinia pseudotuberculosis]|uniref:hypothetical protein n=1 Tax=Yersinia pseudotuberculosis TaxID=633 RepID=UPI001E48F96A